MTHNNQKSGDWCKHPHTALYFVTFVLTEKLQLVIAYSDICESSTRLAPPWSWHGERISLLVALTVEPFSQCQGDHRPAGLERCRGNEG